MISTLGWVEGPYTKIDIAHVSVHFVQRWLLSEPLRALKTYYKTNGGVDYASRQQVDNRKTEDKG